MSATTPQPALSPRRLDANRANARRSTGPRTEAGKRISSQNARKAPPCPIDYDLPRQFSLEWFQEALRLTAPCVSDRARLLLINRCMLQAHEIRWRTLERTLFDTACAETGGDREQAARWVAHQPSFVKALKTYYHWIARRILNVERQLAAIAASAEAPAAESVKVMAAGSSSERTGGASDLQPDGSFVIAWNRSQSAGLLDLGRGWRPVPPVPPVPPVRPVPPVSPIRGRYRLYPHCPAGPLGQSAGQQNEAMPAQPVSAHRFPNGAANVNERIPRPETPINSAMGPQPPIVLSDRETAPTNTPPSNRETGAIEPNRAATEDQLPNGAANVNERVSRHEAPINSAMGPQRPIVLSDRETAPANTPPSNRDSGAIEPNRDSTEALRAATEDQPPNGAANVGDWIPHPEAPTGPPEQSFDTS
ncbi:hypothetical protein [Paludibaculum fermentans]|uniref:hypothetical protein n=1 Tax=Paludibaculum fermentans TaxID=1473598 RepID=UPI003EB79849